MRLAQLNPKTRKATAPGSFVFPPSKKNPKGRYPIADLSHARNALARSSGKPEEAKVKAAVYRKYPELRANTVKAAETIHRYRLPPFSIRLTEGDRGVHVPNRIQLFRTGTFQKWEEETKKWIRFSITRETLAEMVQNWKDRVRGVDIALDFAHKSDEEAAAWFTNLVLDDQKHETILWGEVDWTPDGRAAVGGKKFRYVSPDFAFGWTDNETGQKYGATLFGAGLTNRPVIKNMAPTVELTEVETMAGKATKVSKKIKEMTAEELEVRLSEETDEEKKELIQLRLDEMAEEASEYAEEDDEDGDEDQGDDEDEEAAPKAKKKVKAKEKTLDEMNHDELKKAHTKLLGKVGEMQKSMVKSLSEVETLRKSLAEKDKKADFAILLAEGKAVPAQEKAFLAGDMAEFVKLAAVPKFTTLGAHGDPITPEDTSAQDEVLKLADIAWKEKKVARRTDAVSFVLAENPKLNARYIQEMEGTGSAA